MRGSCASEGIRHNYTGFLAEEHAWSCANVLADACQSRNNIKEVGANAGKHIYLSWETAAGRAYHRYEEILQTWPNALPYNSKALWV